MEPRTQSAPSPACGRGWGRGRIVGCEALSRLTRCARSAPSPASGRGESARAALIRHRHPAVVDQIIERLLHVDISLDHARLLQCNAGLQDRVALLGPDLVVGDGGALLDRKSVV